MGLGVGVWASRTMEDSVSGSKFQVSGFRLRRSYFKYLGPLKTSFSVSSFSVRVSDFGSRVSGFGSRVSEFEFRVTGIPDRGRQFCSSKFRVPCLGVRVSGISDRGRQRFGLSVSGFGFRVSGFGVRLSGIMLRAPCPPCPRTVGYKEGCDQAEGCWNVRTVEDRARNTEDLLDTQRIVLPVYVLDRILSTTIMFF